MIALTRKTDYALIVLAHLAQSPDLVCSARGISDQYRVSHPLLMNIMKQLTNTGFIESVRGAHGGYRLGPDTAQMSLKDLIVALEGPIRLVQCATEVDADQACSQSPWCPVQAPVLRVHDRLEQFLAEVPLSEIIGGVPADVPFDRVVEDTIRPNVEMISLGLAPIRSAPSVRAWSTASSTVQPKRWLRAGATKTVKA
ncbi:MAG: Rrf2 family transcriptional regulator [Planctomycetes bacterium]|nr:Rrf2 family transcriptional regulator [Planctomycetota bacterium]